MNNDNFNNENNNLGNLDNNSLDNDQNQNNEAKQVENNNFNLNNSSFDMNQNNINQNNINQNFTNNNSFTNTNGFENNNSYINNHNIGNNNGFMNNRNIGNNNGFANGGYVNNNGFTNNNAMNNMQFNQNGGNYYQGDFILNDSQLNATRHKSEKGLYITCVIINVLFIIGVLITFALNFDKSVEAMKDYTDNYSSSQLITEDSNIQASKYYDECDISIDPNKEIGNLKDSEFYSKIAEYTIMIIFIAPILLFAVAYMYAQVRSNAIKITPRQFPEVYELIVRYCRRLGLQEIPDAYVVQENGVLNAFSSFVLRKKYIQINADLFEIAYREYHDLKSIGFVIAHELSHIRLKHASFGYQLSIYWANYVPFLGTALSRAREYSCDRVAQVITQDSGVEAIMSLFAGKHLYKRVNVQDYLDNVYNIKGFFVWIYNALSTHPILPKRIVALINRNYYGKLF